MANPINQACVYHVSAGRTVATVATYCRTERQARKLVRPGTRDFVVLRNWAPEQWEEHADRQRHLGKTIKGIWWTNAKKNGWTKVVNQAKLNYLAQRSKARLVKRGEENLGLSIEEYILNERIDAASQSAEYYSQFSL